MGKVVHLPTGQPKRIVDYYRDRNTEIVKLWDTFHGFLQRMIPVKQVPHPMFPSTKNEPPKEETWEFGCLTFGERKIRLPNGAYLRYPKLHERYTEKDGKHFAYWGRDQYGYGWKKIYGALLVENVVQALARIIISDAMRTIARKYRVVLSTHDELVAAVLREMADEIYKWGLEILRTPPDWMPDIPLDAEGGYAREYSK